MKEKLKKIQALLESPFANEREVAAKMLDELAKKYGIDKTDLSESKEYMRSFPYFNKYERDLLVQIICKVLKTNILTSYKTPKKRSFRVKLTNAQYTEIDELYRHFRKALKKEIERILDLSLTSFYSKNELFSGIKTKNSPPPYSNEDLETLRGLYASMKDSRLPNNYLQIGN